MPETYHVAFIPNVRLRMRDGVELSANLWLPAPRAPGERFPAILEMIPYRKDDWRLASDQARMTYLAERGFAGCRLDVRGTGSSQGLALDEYTPAETDDGVEAVAWLAAQPWCNGSVGMWGISYGGFTAIQVAARQPPALKAIAPMYATDDRYTDDVHYLGGCLTASDLAQYAVGMVAMNALPPKAEYAGAQWAAEWKARLEGTPPWLIEWLKQQTDGEYWRNGSLAPDYGRITCAILHFGGWADSYRNPVLRMQQYCEAARRKCIVGPWDHSYPHDAAIGPNLDWLNELVRFFDYTLKGVDNGWGIEPDVRIYVEEYTPPEAFPRHKNGAWRSYSAYPAPGAHEQSLYLDQGDLLAPQPPLSEHTITYPHRPTWGTRGPLCSGGGGQPNGLARDLRPDEALCPTFTSAPLAEPLDVIGFPEVVLYVSCNAPVATAVVRLADVHPDGTSALVSFGVLNLTHRDGHTAPQPLTPGEVYPLRLKLNAAGYRFLPGHRLRVSVASACWPLIWPSPYPAENRLYIGPETPSRLLLPLAPPGDRPAPQFKTTPPELQSMSGGSEARPLWHIVEDVIAGSLTVSVYEGGTTELPGGSLFSDERLEMTASDADPAHARLYNTCHYRLVEHGNTIEVASSGTFRSTLTDIHLDIELTVTLNGGLFFRRAWLESVPRQWL